MTGLEPAHDRIVEVAAVVTDWDFTEIATFQSGVGHDVAQIKKLLNNDFYNALPHNKAEMLHLAAVSPRESEVEEQLLAFIKDHFPRNEMVLLAGNSIHQDRRFIRKWWPKIEQHLHYRMLDVSAWKVVMQGKFGVEFTKAESHRALGDIRESIAEMEFYLQRTQIT